MGSDQRAAHIEHIRRLAAFCRRVGPSLSAAQDRETMLRQAEEYEAEADRLEREAGAGPRPPSTTHMQMQVQQGPPAKQADDKDDPGGES
jgi:hypothetical protein